MTCVEGPLISDCPIPFITCWSKSNYGNPISRWGTVAAGYSLQWKRREIPRHAGLELENGSGFSRKGQRHWLSSSPREKLQRQVRSRQPGTPSPPVLKSKRRSTPRPSGEGLACHVPGARQSGPPLPPTSQEELDFGQHGSEAEKNASKKPCPLVCANSNAVVASDFIFLLIPFLLTWKMSFSPEPLLGFQ